MRYSLQNNTSYSNINVLYNSSQASNRSLFSKRTEQYSYGMNGQEKDDEISGSGNDYDFGARIYDSRLGRWLAIDNEFRMYPNYSPYCAFGDNPIHHVDIDGNKFKIYYEVKDEQSGKTKIRHVTVRDINPETLQKAILKSGNNAFVKNVVEAINYVKPADTDYNILNSLAEAKRTIKIKESKGEGTTKFTDINNTVLWNPNSGLNVTTDGIYQGFQSPAVGLYHELGHAFRNLFHKISSIFSPMIPDKQHTNKDEKNNTGKYEASVTEKLGEPVRDRYDGGSEVFGKKVTESENRHIVKLKNEKK